MHLFRNLSILYDDAVLTTSLLIEMLFSMKSEFTFNCQLYESRFNEITDFNWAIDITKCIYIIDDNSSQ